MFKFIDLFKSNEPRLPSEYSIHSEVKRCDFSHRTIGKLAPVASLRDTKLRGRIEECFAWIHYSVWGEIFHAETSAV